MWKDTGKVHGWKHLRAPSVKWLWKERSTKAVCVFSRTTRVGCISTRRMLPEEGHKEGHEEAGAGDEVEGVGPGPPNV